MIDMQASQRIEAALARMADAMAALAAGLTPSGTADDPLTPGGWYVWAESALRAVPRPRTLPLQAFRGIDQHRDALAENIRRHAAGLPAHDMLLWGARGMGKSALLRAVHAAQNDTAQNETPYQITLIQVARTDVAGLARLFQRLAKAPPQPITVFLDDLAFDASNAEVHALRALLDGGIEQRPDHVRLAVTSNRRHLLPNPLSAPDPDDANPRDTRDDGLALADRFGLRLGFHPCDQATYLAICESLAAVHGVRLDPAAALTFAAGRGNRSGRIAWHFIMESAGAQGIHLPG